MMLRGNRLLERLCLGFRRRQWEALVRRYVGQLLIIRFLDCFSVLNVPLFIFERAPASRMGE